MRIKFALKCKECSEINYITKKNKTTHPEKVEFNKYCSKCNKKTQHVESTHKKG